ncbi:hypothetical protein QTP86_008821 [Hemibagrus guttatus]|nr:hypothetical protein QTP86_008821 [Hemibagrus guttatus]
MCKYPNAQCNAPPSICLLVSEIRRSSLGFESGQILVQTAIFTHTKNTAAGRTSEKTSEDYTLGPSPTSFKEFHS